MTDENLALLMTRDESGLIFPGRSLNENCRQPVLVAASDGQSEAVTWGGGKTLW